MGTYKIGLYMVMGSFTVLMSREMHSSNFAAAIGISLRLSAFRMVSYSKLLRLQIACDAHYILLLRKMKESILCKVN